MICPGIFTNHGRWKGISIAELLKLAGADEGITHGSIRGRRDALQKRNTLLFLMPKNLAGCVSRVWAIVLNQKE